MGRFLGMLGLVLYMVYWLKVQDLLCLAMNSSRISYLESAAWPGGAPNQEMVKCEKMCILELAKTLCPFYR